MSDPLKTLIERKKSEAFHSPEGASDEDALGILIAAYFEWDGAAIMRTAARALEDANFHSESAEVAAMAERA